MGLHPPREEREEHLSIECCVPQKTAGPLGHFHPTLKTGGPDDRTVIQQYPRLPAKNRFRLPHSGNVILATYRRTHFPDEYNGISTTTH